MTFVVLIWATQDDEKPDAVGPFEDAHGVCASEWAKRYVERVRERFYRCEVEPLSPCLLGFLDDNGFAEVVFDPANGVDVTPTRSSRP